MMIYLSAFLLSWILSASAQEYQTRGTFPYRFSHLSPLITYTPISEDPVWNVTRESHYTTQIDAFVEIPFYGHSLRLTGWGQNINITDPRPEGGLSYSQSSYSRFEVLRESWGLYPNGTNATFQGPILDMDGPSSFQDNWIVDMRLNQSDNAFLDFNGGNAMLTIPSDRGAGRNATLVSAVDSDNTTSSLFVDEQNAWIIESPSFNNTAGLIVEPYSSERTSYSQSLLSTTTPQAPLRITIPQTTSVLLLHGTVGPDQGGYRVEIVNRTEMLDFDHPMVYNYTARRPINAIDEVKCVAHLDPRVEYDAVVTLQEEGQKADIQGAVFVSYTQYGDKNITDWWTDPSVLRQRENDDGLTGGEIAGIVIGAIAGVALMIALTIWWTRRRRTKESAALGEDIESRNKLAEAPTLDSRA